MYSVIPNEVIFQNQEQLEQQELQEIQIGHITMMVESSGLHEGKIVRMISPDPQDYLNPNYAPGQKVYFQPSFSS